MTRLSTITNYIYPPDISIFHTFQKPPYGGANQFLMALRDAIKKRGFRVGENFIAPRTKACILNAFAFDTKRLKQYKNETCLVLHRVDGPVGKYRGTDPTIDQQVAEINAEFADVTVFQSQYSYQANLDLGLHFKSPQIIINASNPQIFHAHQKIPFNRNRKIRIISTSWSSNPNKGGPTYKQLENMLDWNRFEYTFVGQTPIPFNNIKTLPPVSSHKLAHLLRQHDIYITASLHDPCSNALIEALSCGLPALYANSGGHAELVGKAGLPFDDASEIPERLNQIVDEYEERQAHIQIPTLDQITDQYLQAMQITNHNAGDHHK